jgi:glutamate dehydrogenase (NAD(P)+)
VPREYIFGLDMGLNETDAAILMDEVGDRGAAVGLPQALGGLPYDQLGVTGYGVAEAADAAASECGFSLRGATVAIQGFGAVGRATAERVAELGGVVTAASTAKGAVVDPEGLDVAKLVELSHQDADDCVLNYGNAVASDAATAARVDVFIPAAREDVIGSQAAMATTARLVVEGANMPITPDGLAVLERRGIAVVPDFIANAGGIVAAAHSMQARYSPFAVEPGGVFAMVSAKVRANAVAVLQVARSRGTGGHEAAHRIARQRVLEAMRLRGQVAV